MKKIAFVRHGRKGGELIAADQLTEIKINGITGLNGLVFNQSENGLPVSVCEGSGLERTAQTAQAYLDYIYDKGIVATQILPADPRFGNADLFKQMTGNAELMAEQKRSGWYNALKTVAPDLLTKIQKDQAEALERKFAEIEENEFLIIIGHTPMIELLAHSCKAEDVEPSIALNLRPDLALKELQGILFVQDFDFVRNNDIKITPVALIG
ncbi:MAG: hypothetical protein WC453_00490 [Patescibacteria group bacterium]